MSDEAVFFLPYDAAELEAVVGLRLERAFQDGALPDDVRAYGVQQAADRWGDARKTLTLFRHAGETATERGDDAVTRDCIETNLTTTEQDATIEKLSQLPLSHFAGLVGITGWTDQAGEITQPVTTAEIADVAQSAALPAPYQLGERAIRDVVTELETMGLVET